jgi:hypothetical protein
VRCYAVAVRGTWARCTTPQPRWTSDTGPVRWGGVSRWRRMPRSARTCGAARAAEWVRRAPWAHRGRSGCCGCSGDLRERAGRGGFPGVADPAGPDRVATCPDGAARAHRTRGCASGVDAGHAHRPARLRRLAGVESAAYATLPDVWLFFCCRTRRISQNAQRRVLDASWAWRLCRPSRHRRSRDSTSTPASRPTRVVRRRSRDRLQRRRWPPPLRSRASGWPFPGTTGSGQSAARRRR